MTSSAPAAGRANKVFPGGKHTRLPLTHVDFGPRFLERGEGCRVWDTDGRSHIDYLCGFGCSVLGYNHPDVEAAASVQGAKGTTLTGPTER